MPRNSSGTYTLPSGNPVVPDTLILDSWANPTMSDLGAAITDSLDRQGRGAMLAPLKLPPGGPTAPAMSFSAESNLGWYRSAAGVMALAVGGVLAASFDNTGLHLASGLSVTSPVTHPLGTALLPSITFTGDLNTGIFSPGADQVGLVTAGVQRVFIDATGNVGIKVAAANGFMFEVNGAGANGPLARFSGGTVQTRGLELSSIAVGGVNGAGFLWNAPGSPANPAHAWALSGNENMRLQVLTGASTAGSLAVNSALNGAALIVDRLGTSTMPALTAGTVAAFLGSSAAGSPAYLSLVAGNTSQAGVDFADTDADARGWVRYNHSLDTLQLAAAGVAGAFLDDAGVFIINPSGTSFTPSSFVNLTRLQVASSVAGTAGGTFTAFTADSTGTRHNAMKSRGAAIGTHAAVINADSLMQWSFAGSDGAGFATAARIDVSVDGAVAAGSVPGRIIFFTTPLAGAVPTECMRLNNQGNVTIAAALSGATLSVQGGATGIALQTSTAIAGGTLQWNLSNSSVAAASDARLQLSVASAAAGDPFLSFVVSAVQTWMMGVDNSDSDRFKISVGAALGTNDALYINTNGAVVILPPTAAATSLQIQAISGSTALSTSQDLPGVGAIWRLENISNVAASSARMNIIAGGAAAGDPSLLWQVTGGNTFSAGIDNSDADAFIICEGATLGATNRIRIDGGTGVVSAGVAPAVASDGLDFATTGWVNDATVGGSGRTWQNMTGVGGRALGAAIVAPAYPIAVNISFNFPATNGTSVVLTVGGITVASRTNGATAGAYADSISAVVPPGASYTLSNTVGVPTIATWAELR